jgi:hypothetical protein
MRSIARLSVCFPWGGAPTATFLSSTGLIAVGLLITCPLVVAGTSFSGGVADRGWVCALFNLLLSLSLSARSPARSRITPVCMEVCVLLDSEVWVSELLSWPLSRSPASILCCVLRFTICSIALSCAPTNSSSPILRQLLPAYRSQSWSQMLQNCFASMNGSEFLAMSDRNIDLTDSICADLTRRSVPVNARQTSETKGMSWSSATTSSSRDRLTNFKHGPTSSVSCSSLPTARAQACSITDFHLPERAASAECSCSVLSGCFLLHSPAYSPPSSAGTVGVTPAHHIFCFSASPALLSLP